MNTHWNLPSASRTLATASVALAIFATTPALAGDVKLASGGVWRGDAGAQVRVTYTLNSKELTLEGKVVKTDKAFIVVEVTEGTKTVKKTISSYDLKKIETLDVTAAAASTAPATPTAPKTPTAPTTSTAATTSKPVTAATSPVVASSSGVPNIFVLPWEGMVGLGARHNEIEAIGIEADKYGPGQIIVLLVDSPGGMVVEGDRVHETMKKLRERHRVVAWIKKAISAAAFTSLHCDEIYFMRCGALGSITMFAGQTAISGKELDAWLDKLGEVCEYGGRPAVVGQAMVTNPILCSYDRDEEGNITWYDTLEGKYDLSDASQNLTLNAENALHCKFSDGTADTVAELAVCLQLKEWKEVSDIGRKIHANWQKLVSDCEDSVPRVLNDLQNPSGSNAIEQAQSQVKALTKLLEWWRKCEPCVMMAGVPSEEALEKGLEEAKKRLKDMKKD